MDLSSKKRKASGKLSDEARKMARKDLNPRVLMTTSMGEVVLEIFEDQMPYTAANFINLVSSGF